MSRFGRNMIDTGYYLELVFPLYQIRFIAISDCYDSADYDGNTGGMDMALKLLVHEQYSRDLSKKIKTSKRAKALRGGFVSKNCVFGYKRVGNCLEIDEPAAETIRFIFSLTLSGNSIDEIRQKLYEEKHPTPNMHKNRAEHSGYIWNQSSIRSILMDEQYTGTYVSGKTENTVIGSRNSRKIDESEWIKIPNKHPAIIDKAVFDSVSEILKARCKPLRNEPAGIAKKQKSSANPLHGKIFCGSCGHNMTFYSSLNSNYKCRFTTVATDAECNNLMIPYVELERMVMKSIRMKAQSIIKSIITSTDSSEPNSSFDEQIALLDDAKRTIYERLIIGEIDTDTFKAEKAVLDSKLSRLKKTKVAYAKDSERNNTSANLLQIAEDSLKKKKLTGQLVDALIERILVYTDNRVEVIWKSPGLNYNRAEVDNKTI
jgi:hypothetical protein